jgi:DNA-binding NarL/FixJ family response regulator
MTEVMLHARDVESIEELRCHAEPFPAAVAGIVEVDRDSGGLVLRLFVPGPDDDERRDADRLSPSELRVLGLVAQGATNREVSESLSLSVATVRKHLEHIYAKLGVRNRTAAAARTFPLGRART